jgi:uncharacterized RDD family membrane protein YckC
MSQITVLNKDNVPTGPFTRTQIAEKLQSAEFSLDSLAFIEGLSQWTPLRDILAKVDAASDLSSGATLSVALPVNAPAYSYAATMQPPGHLVYAGFWPRVVAHILDNMIVSVPFVFIWFGIVVSVVGFGVFTQFAQQNATGPSAAFIGTVIILYLSLILGRFILVWLYHALLESGPHQSTWGKRALGLKVTSFTGGRISFGHASGRYFSTLITNMTMGIGYLMVAFTDRKQALHDMIAGTLVIRT